MTIDSEAGALAAPSAGHHGHRHTAAHHDSGAHHGATHDHEAHDARVSAGSFSPFLASALDRLALAVVLSGLVWIGVVWALT